MNALEKITRHDERKAELQELYTEQSNLRQTKEQARHDIMAARGEVQQFERNNSDANQVFNITVLDEFARAHYQKLQAEVERLRGCYEDADAQLPDVAERIRAAQEATSETVEVAAAEVIGQQEIVAQAKAEAAKITTAIEAQRELKEQTARSIEDNQAKVEADRENALARELLGEIESAQGVENVADMAADHYDERRQTLKEIQATITGLTRRLEKADSTLQIEQERLQALLAAHLETEFHRARVAYEKAAAKAVDALDGVMGFNRLLKLHGHSSGVSLAGGFNLPSFKGSRAGNSALHSDRDLNWDRAEQTVIERLRKTGIKV